jgi:hypothetical protein
VGQRDADAGGAGKNAEMMRGYLTPCVLRLLSEDAFALCGAPGGNYAYYKYKRCVCVCVCVCVCSSLSLSLSRSLSLSLSLSL